MEAKAVDHCQEAVARVDDAVHGQSQATADDDEASHMDARPRAHSVRHPNLDPTRRRPDQPCKARDIENMKRL